MESEFISIADQNPPVCFLNNLLKNGIIPNALLFTGNKGAGAGKEKTALSFAAACNCATTSSQEPCGTCKACKKIKSGIHPDIIQIKPEGRIIKIEQIRDVLRVLAMKPYEAVLRVVIISEAEKMNPSAANALLKVLEEPEDTTVFILTADKKSELLPTIISRCQHFKFRGIPENNQSKADSRRGYEKWLIELISSLSSSRTAMQLCLAEKLSKNKKNPEYALDVIFSYLRDILIYKFVPEKIVNKDMISVISADSQKKSIDSILFQIKKLNILRGGIDSNVNLRIALEAFFIEIAKD